jgi:mono/diheme cytochrome c family protein
VIGTIVFVLVFLVVGLTVVMAAMRSGRGPQRRRRRNRGAERAWGLGVAAVIALLGVGLPIAVLIANNNSEAKQGPSGVKLTSAQEHGRQLFARNCATCHTLRGANAVGRVGPNLDTLNGGTGLQTAFVLDAIKNGRARGNGQMPAGLLTGGDAQDVANFVSRVAGR